MSSSPPPHLPHPQFTAAMGTPGGERSVNGVEMPPTEAPEGSPAGHFLCS